MSLYKPNSSDNEDGFIIGRSGHSELTSAIIRQFSLCTYTENRLHLPDNLMFLN